MVASVNFGNAALSGYINNNITSDTLKTYETAPVISFNESINNGDSFVYESETINGEITTVEELEEKFESIQAEQGIVGKTIDKIKNKIPFLSKIGFKGSDEVQAAVEKVKTGEMTLEEANEILEKYESNQDTATEIALDTATLLIVSGACMLAGPLGLGALAIVGVATAVGAASRVALGAAEAATNEVEGDYTFQNVKEDAAKGGIIGLLKGLGKVFGCRFRKPKEQDIKRFEQYASVGVNIANIIKAQK